MYGQYDRNVFDKVSDADDEIPHRSTTTQQHSAQTANNDTNITDKVDRIEEQMREQ